MAVRQEVVNVVLAQVLQDHGLVAVPEQILRQPFEAARLPDVLVDFQGLRLAIEAEFISTPGAKKWAYNKAQDRVNQAIAHVGVAVVYPGGLRHVPFERLKSELQSASIHYVVLTEADITRGLLFPTGEKPSFSRGTVDDLVDALRRAYIALLKDETLQRAIELLERGLEHLALVLQFQPVATYRLAQALGIAGLPDDPKAMGMAQRAAVNRIAGLILINAMIFQQVLSLGNSRVRGLTRFHQDTKLSLQNIVSDLRNHWQFILDEINYYPIFYTACELLSNSPADIDFYRAVEDLLQRALTIVGWKASLRHDLAGRIYHRLLQEAKHLGAYYTAIPSAALLLKLALRPDGYSVDWSDPAVLQEMRLADLACGTGTLLMAAADVVVDNYVNACAVGAKKPEINRLHRILVENMIYGYDVLPSAVHLTASTLSLRVPDAPVNVTHLYRVPLGGSTNALGTLEFFEMEATNGMLFGQPEGITEQMTGTKKVAKRTVRIPPLDLCAMNPPFTRSVGGNLLFGNLPEKERQGMQTKLKKMVADQRISASITAGLGSVFVALADKYLKSGGRLALVLPRALISGVAWEPTRQIMNERYQLEYLIVSHEPDHWNFSENTNLSEVLVVARKRTPGEKEKDARVVCVNLWRQPRNSIEALTIARCVLPGNVPELESGRGALEVTVGDAKYGEALSVPWNQLRRGSWGFPCAFAQVDLVRALYQLMHGRLYLPREGVRGKVPLCRLRDLGELGFDRRDVHDGFDLAAGVTPYPALWGHDSSQVTTMGQAANRWLKPLNQPKPGRPMRLAEHLWTKASRVLLAERLWLKTMRFTAVLMNKEALSNVWWCVVLEDGRRSEDWEKALVLWLNSSLGFLLLLGHREETRGAWVDFKKPVLEKMPVLDLHKTGAGVRRKLAQAYDQLSDKPLLPFPEMGADETRAAIDQAIADALRLPNLEPLRELLAREPVICVRLDRLIP